MASVGTAMKRSPPFKKLLVANRGEIAIRILRAATELGIRTVAIYTHEDRFALYRFKADEAYKIGRPGEPVASYLDAKNICDKALEWGVDAIHPGYGFLSESAEFAELCVAYGITFIGPSPAVLRAFGNKVSARTVATEAGLPVVPGSKRSLDSLATAQSEAEAIGYPLTLKAVSGGGGKGIRMLAGPDDLAIAYERARSEALTSFGRADLYLEKQIIKPRHIEVQILGDQHGHIVHLYERDCSIQRRHQKVVEVAPALGISSATRKAVCDYAIKAAKHLRYVGLGTVEFLVEDSGAIFFLEVNPRIQVEHTVTEMVTGVDLVQASILVASGRSLRDQPIGIKDQSDIIVRGAAIQCRITTEDPSNNFAPDTGQIIAYRPAAGFGIRLDEGLGTAGGTITPHYDSLLVKVTAFAKTFEEAAAKMHRSLSEFRIRGLRHNIPLLKKVVSNPDFLRSRLSTAFFEEHPGLFQFKKPRDRATKMLRYIAEVTVNNPHGMPSKKPPGEDDAPTFGGTERLVQFRCAALSPEEPAANAKVAFDAGGATGLKAWIKSQSQLLLTDTTMRDAHQSLFATRLRTRDIVKAADFYREFGHTFFSLEVWGGATFDTCLRFLHEDPWVRLKEIRRRIPNVLLQMLLRGDNAVGYANYPKWVVEDFIKKTADIGLDVFRIFDCLNQTSKMAVATDQVKQCGAIAEVCICYTGNMTSPAEEKYTLDYYLEVAKDCASMGADILAIKDMAGLLRPKSARVLIEGLRETVDLPIHLHVHDTSGAGVATLLESRRAGCHIVDGAVSSMSGLTSQPSMNALIAVLEGETHCPAVPLPVLDELARYWEGVRTMYQDFDPGIKATSTEVYRHEIPGGQFSNLFEQAKRVGVGGGDFHKLTQRYSEVNELLGNIIKVTPSSKVVGDFALLLQKEQLTGKSYLQDRPQLDYPDSVISFFKGHMGVPYGGFPEEVRSLVLGPNAPAPEAAPTAKLASFDQVQLTLAELLGRSATVEEVLSYSLYPKVFLDFVKHREQFGDLGGLTTPIFFYGLRQGVEMETDLEAGKTLIIALRGISEPDDQGNRTVFFSLNGFPRSVEVKDQQVKTAGEARRKADPTSPLQLGANMPGKILEILVEVGGAVESGQPLLVTESMKMEYILTAKGPGKVVGIFGRVGEAIASGDLLVELAPV